MKLLTNLIASDPNRWDTTLRHASGNDIRAALREAVDRRDELATPLYQELTEKLRSYVLWRRVFHAADGTPLWEDTWPHAPEDIVLYNTSETNVRPFRLRRRGDEHETGVLDYYEQNSEGGSFNLGPPDLPPSAV